MIRSEEFFLLSERIDSLEAVLNVTVQDLGILATFIILLVGAIQLLATYRLNKNDVESAKRDILLQSEISMDRIKEELEDKINQSLAESGEEIEKRQKRFERESKFRETGLDADISRLLSLTAAQNDLHVKEIYYRLDAADKFNQCGESDLVTTFLTGAQNTLGKIAKSDINDLRKELPDIEKRLTSLEKSRPTEVGIFRDLLSSKMTQDKKTKKKSKGK